MAEERTVSRWEWLPAALVPVLAGVHFFAAAPGGTVSRLSFFIAAGLLPGTVLRLFGKSSWATHRVCFALSLVAFVLDNPGLRPDRAGLARMLADWPLVTAGFVISFTQVVFGTLRTRLLLVDSGVRISLHDAFRLCLIGGFFNIFLPGATGGDAYRVYALTHEHASKLAPAIASITLDRFLGLPSLILVVLAGVALDYGFFRSNSLLSGLFPFICAAAAVCAAFVWYLAFAGKKRNGGDSGGGGRIRAVHSMIAANVKRPSTLPLCLLHGFLAHVATVLSCLCFGAALGVEGVPPIRYFLIVPMAMTVNAIPGAPGGVGQGELAMATFLGMAAEGAASGGNAQAGVMVMLLFRLSNMAAGLAGGALYMRGARGKAWR